MNRSHHEQVNHLRFSLKIDNTNVSTLLYELHQARDLIFWENFHMKYSRIKRTWLHGFFHCHVCLSAESLFAAIFFFFFAIIKFLQNSISMNDWWLFLILSWYLTIIIANFANINLDFEHKQQDWQFFFSTQQNNLLTDVDFFFSCWPFLNWMVYIDKLSC